MSQFLEQGEWYVGTDFPAGRYRISCRPKSGASATVDIKDSNGDYLHSYYLDYDDDNSSCVVKLKSGYSIEVDGDKVKITPYV